MVTKEVANFRVKCPIAPNSARPEPAERGESGYRTKATEFWRIRLQVESPNSGESGYIMLVERLLQINIAVLTSLGSLLLGMGERDLTLSIVAMLVAFSSVYLTDVKGWLQLNTTVTNIAGLVALAASLKDMDGFQGERQLVTMANLLIYLQLVLLLRKKNHSSYWLLALLSLLQVAVASALNLDAAFGMLLLVYMLAGLMALALFYVHRETSRFAAAPKSEAPHRPVPGICTELPAPSRPARRWPLPLANEMPAFVGRRIIAGSKDCGISWPFARQILRMGALTLVLAIIFFVGMPRGGRGLQGRTRTASATQRVTGFSQSVTLGALGEVLENPERVMTVRLYDEQTREHYRVAGAPLIRGALLYDYKKGQWQRRKGQVRPQDMPVARSLPAGQHYVRQFIQVGSLDEPVLFCIAPAIKDMSNEDLMFSPDSEQLFRSDDRQDDLFEYALLTDSLREHLQSDVAAAPRKPDALEYDQLLRLPAPVNGRDTLAGLKRTAKQLVETLPVNRELQARAIEAYFNTPRFRYSLQPVARDFTLDPVEDFVMRNPEGHCEYFASALALMLRSVKIPARLAIGFKGADWNSFGKFYDVKHLHAHAWVEVYFGENTPPRGAARVHSTGNGYWLTLDPTPAGDGVGDFEDNFGPLSFQQFTDFSQFVWFNYVLGMDSRRQQQAIFQPLVKNVEQSLNRLASPQFRGKVWSGIRSIPGPASWVRAGGGWFTWRGMLVAMTGLLMCAVGYQSARAAWRTARWLFDRASGRAGQTRGYRVPFYQRFETLLARHRLLRPPSQTPREFAQSAGGQLAESAHTRPVAALPRSIAEAYYRVRFGQHELDGDQLSAVEQALASLAQTLNDAALKRGPELAK